MNSALIVVATEERTETIPIGKNQSFNFQNISVQQDDVPSQEGYPIMRVTAHLDTQTAKHFGGLSMIRRCSTKPVDQFLRLPRQNHYTPLDAQGNPLSIIDRTDLEPQYETFSLTTRLIVPPDTAAILVHAPTNLGARNIPFTLPKE